MKAIGPRRAYYAEGDGLIWASDDVPAAKYKLLSDAFRPSLERCSQLMHAAMP